jgi:CheY-like chemotaxis protein
MDGYQAAAKLRELQREGGRKKCMIVAISSNDEDAIVRRAIDAGCDHYLVKPAARDALLRILAGEVKPGGLEPVVFDPALAAALPAFLLSRREILDRMPGALEHSRAELRQLAHKLAGSFAMYGFTWAAAECRALQRDAESGQAGDLARRIAAVRAHLDQVKIETR